jgi:hypothetical protein
MITVTAAVQAANDSGQPAIELVKAEFAGIPAIYLTTAAFDIDWDGQTWLSTGLLLDTDLLDRVDELRTRTSALGFSGVDLSLVPILLNTNQVGRKVTVYEGFLSFSGGVIADPYIREILFIDDWAITQGTTSATIVTSLSGEWADFEFVAGIKTTDASLQRYSPGDELFKFSKDIKKNIKWGGE